MSKKHTPESNTTMKVKLTRDHIPWREGQILEVTDDESSPYLLVGDLVLDRGACTIIPDEPENRVPFNYDQWKEKGGRVWYGNKELHQLTRFEVESEYKYAGVYDVYGVKEIGTWTDKQLTMSAPDEVYYVNKYPKSISSSHKTIENAKDRRDAHALHILEINITKGTNKIVHTYNEKV